MSLDKTNIHSKIPCVECRTELEIWNILDDNEQYQLYCPTCKAGCGYITKVELMVIS